MAMIKGGKNNSSSNIKQSKEKIEREILKDIRSNQEYKSFSNKRTIMCRKKNTNNAN